MTGALGCRWAGWSRHSRPPTTEAPTIWVTHKDGAESQSPNVCRVSSADLSALSGRQGTTCIHVGCDPGSMTQVAGRQVRDRESSVVDQGVHRSVQMTTHPRPEG